MTDEQRVAEAYLMGIRDKVKAIKLTEQEIEALEYAATGQGAIRYDKDRVQGSSGEDRMVIFIQDALEKRAELEELLAEVDELKVNCYHLIKKLDNTDERICLEWYYINASPMLETIGRLCVSERKAYYIRDDALQHFGELL